MEKMIYFIRYVNCKSIKILGLHFCRFIGKIQEQEKKFDG